RLVVVDVVYVQVRGQTESPELPLLVDSHVELVESVRARAVRPGRRDRGVRARVVIDGASDVRRVGRTGHVTEARADGPPLAEIVAPGEVEDVRLVELEDVEGLVVAVAPFAAGERVREKAGEATRRDPLQEPLHAVSATRSGVLVDRAARGCSLVRGAHDEVV